MSRDIVDLDDVIKEENEELALRRKQAGFVHPGRAAADNEYRPEDIDDPVGLAVSGGGVRSAAFSLGVIQSLYERGLLRFCDYLSTVSGGSYVGGFLASLAVHGHSELQWTGRNRPTTARTNSALPASPAPPESNGSPALPQSNGSLPAQASASAPAITPEPTRESAATIRRRTDALAERITIEPDAQRRQPHYVRRLILGSSYLNRPLLFFSHWLPGFLQNNVISIGGLLCVCALGAWLFRLLYTEDWMRLLRALGFSDDVSRAYFPTVVVFSIWVIVLSYRALRSFLGNRSGGSSVAPSLTLLLLVMFLVSSVSLIGVGNVNTTFLVNRLNLPLRPEFVAWFQTIAQWTLYTILAAAIIPYLSAEALLKSGAAGASWRDRFVFKIMTHAMLWGVPLVLFGILASENISNFNTRRDDQYLLTKQTVKDWSLLQASLTPPKNPTPTATPPVAPQGGFGKVGEANAQLAAKLAKSRVPDDPADLALPTGRLHDANRDGQPDWIESRKDATGPSALQMIDRVAKGSQHRDEIERHTSFLPRLGSAIAWALGSRENNEFEQLLEHEWKFQHEKDLAVALLNDQLLRPDFAQNFEPLATWFRDVGDGKKRESPPDFPGDQVRFLKAYDQAKSVEARVAADDRTAAHLEEFRQAHLLEAVVSYQLALHPDRSSWSADLHPVRERLKEELHVLRHPVEKLSGQNEISEAAIEGNLRAMEEAHFQLLHEFYGPERMYSHKDVFARVVVDADQAFRRSLFVGALLVFLIAGMCIDLNSTSLHRFYRDRLASVWLVGANDKVPALTQLKTSEHGAPYLLVNCALSFLRSDSQDREPTASFLFSHRACGSNRLGFAPSSRYEGGQFDLADAMAISGGAITPTASRNLAVRALMWLMNWRLGRWMSNPSVRALLDRPTSYRRIWQRPQALHLLLSWLLVPEEDRDFHFVSDGGLHENLGIEPLIERRCRLIFAIDAGADPKEQFEDLVKLLLRLRLHHGVEIEALNENSPLEQRTAPAILARSPLGRLLARDEQGRPTADGTCRSHFVLAKIHYPDREEPGWLVYMRPGFDGDESEALRRFRTQNANFPNDSTDDQFYTFARFEAYRLLGEHIGSSLCAQLAPNLAEVSNFEQLLKMVERYAASTTVNATTTLAAPASPTPIVSRASDAGPESWHVMAVDNILPPSDQPPPEGAPPDSESAPAASAPAGNGSAASLAGEPPDKQARTAELVKEIDTALAEIQASQRDVPHDALARLKRTFDELDESDPKAAEGELRKINRQFFQLLDDGSRPPPSGKKKAAGSGK